MLAVLVNCAAVIAGSLIGLLLARKKNIDLTPVVTSAAGIITLIIGIQMAFSYQNIIYLSLSLILGGLLGTWWDIDGKILAFGRFLEKKLYHARTAENSAGTDVKPAFAYAFLNASVLFCVGAMAIVGSFQAGTSGDYTTIFTKSILDGFMAIVFTAAMGIGTAFSAVSILIYQGALTLLSVAVAPYVSERMIAEITGTGGTLIIMIGINLLELKKLKTGNFLPAMLLIVLFVLADPFISRVFSI